MFYRYGMLLSLLFVQGTILLLQTLHRAGREAVIGSIFMPEELFTVPMILTLVFGIALIFSVVYLVMWLNDRRISRLFNERLLEFQKEVQLRNEESLTKQEEY